MNWSVFRVNDDGRSELVNHGMCHLAAETLAGAMRDQSTEAEVAAGWNYVARKQRRPGTMKDLIARASAPKAVRSLWRRQDAEETMQVRNEEERRESRTGKLIGAGKAGGLARSGAPSR